MTSIWSSLADLLAGKILVEVDVSDEKLRLYPKNVNIKTGRHSSIIDVYTNIIALNILPKLYYETGKKLYLEVARNISKFIHTAWRETGMGLLPEYYDLEKKQWSSTSRVLDNALAVPVLLKTSSILEDPVLETVAENITGWIMSKIITSEGSLYELYDRSTSKPLEPNGLNMLVSLVLFRLYNEKGRKEYLQASTKTLKYALELKDFIEKLSSKPLKLALSTISLAILNYYFDYTDDKLYNELSKYSDKLLEILLPLPAMPPEHPPRREEVDVIASAYTIIALILSYRVLGDKRYLEKARDILSFLKTLKQSTSEYRVVFPATTRKSWLGRWRRENVLDTSATILVGVAEEIYNKFDAKNLNLIIDYVL